ncbi:MAG: DNA-binding domain-containing protein [Methylococcaceae bacterium]|nr:DNA-binding domain-containing protein [Methylococcaceae bacterium]
MTSTILSLTDLQQAFQTAVLHLQDTPPEFVVDTDQASSAERFTVYTEAYRLRLIEALSADYPGLKSLLGAEDFDAMGRAYIDASPSDQFSIRWFGRHLPVFLTETMPYAEQPGIAELAFFEWALSEAFDAPDNAVIDYSRLAAVEPSAWPLLKLKLHPSLRRVDLHYNAPQIWQAANQQEPLPAFIKTTEAQAWIIWRQQLKLLFRSLSVQEAFAIDAFLQGQSFADVCAGLVEWLDEEQVVLNAAGFLQTWLRDGWIADVDTSNND